MTSTQAITFDIQAVCPWSGARAGKVQTPHGVIDTPVFMPVGTNATVKALCMDQVEETGAQIILSNSYHLYLRPGLEVLKEAGGLHRFNDWHKPILTDSGGYQVFSLSGTRQITHDGVMFQSHIDGSRHMFTPEYVMDIQRVIGADIVMGFDECPPFPTDYSYAKDSLALTNRWLDRCFDRFNETNDHYGGHPYCGSGGLGVCKVQAG